MIIRKIKWLALPRYRPVRAWWKARNAREILVLGDSHAQIFDHPLMQSALPGYFFTVVSIGGATVSGLKNPNSKTQAMPIFESAIQRTKARFVITFLGEIDTGFVIWHRAEKHQQPVAEMLAHAIKGYQSLLLHVSQSRRVVCISAPLPTIQDDQDWGEVANARREVKTSQRDRTDLTVEFNRQMAEFCEREGIISLNLDAESLGPDGLVSKTLLNSDPTDHHYEPEAHARLLISRLREHFPETLQ